MMWILVFIVTIVALVAVALIVGYVLPKAHVVSSSVRFKQSPSTIWHAITEVEDFPSWRPDVKTVELLPEMHGKAIWREISKTGHLTLEVVESEPMTHLKCRIADPNLPFGGRWTYDIVDLTGGCCSLTITEDGEVYNPLFRLVSRFFVGHYATIDSYLKALGKKFEEEVEPLHNLTT